MRFAVRPTILPRGGGPDGRSPWLLRKGQGIGWSTYHMHRSEALYGPDARVYRPERWEDGTLLHRVHDMGAGFLDFHTGPRLCLGSECLSIIFPPTVFLLISFTFIPTSIALEVKRT